MKPIRKKFACEIVRRSADGTPTAVRVRASDETVDQYDDIIVQDFDLSDYAKNPAVLWEHGLYDCIDPVLGMPIGYASDVAIVNGALEATLNFVDENANPYAPMIAQGFAQGSIRAVSVGFRYGESRYEKRDGKDVRILSKNKLIEISPCAIGANPNATTIEMQKSLKTNRTARAPTRKTNMEMTPEQLAAFIASLAAKLGIDPATATPEAILAKLDEQAASAKAVQESVGADTPAEVPAKVASLMIAQKENAILKSQLKGNAASLKDQVDTLVKKGIDTGKVLPALAEEVRKFGMTHGVAALQKHLDLKGVELPTTTHEAQPSAVAKRAFSKDERALMKAFGVSEEDIEKANAKRARASEEA